MLFVRATPEQKSFGTATEVSAKSARKATNIIVNRIHRVKISVRILYERSVIARNHTLGVMCTDSSIRLGVHGIEISFKLI